MFIGSYLPTFRDNLSVSSFRVKQSKKIKDSFLRYNGKGRMVFVKNIKVHMGVSI